jgi:hypothetical protein
MSLTPKRFSRNCVRGNDLAAARSRASRNRVGSGRRPRLLNSVFGERREREACSPCLSLPTVGARAGLAFGIAVCGWASYRREARIRTRVPRSLVRERASGGRSRPTGLRPDPERLAGKLSRFLLETPKGLTRQSAAPHDIRKEVSAGFTPDCLNRYCEISWED